MYNIIFVKTSFLMYIFVKLSKFWYYKHFEKTRLHYIHNYLKFFNLIADTNIIINISHQKVNFGTDF